MIQSAPAWEAGSVFKAVSGTAAAMLIGMLTHGTRPR